MACSVRCLWLWSWKWLWDAPPPPCSHSLKKHACPSISTWLQPPSAPFPTLTLHEDRTGDSAAPRTSIET